MKEAVRRSSRTPRRSAENSESVVDQSRSVSHEKKQGRKKRSIVSETESEPKKSNVSTVPIDVPKIQKKIIDGRMVDSFCWICHKLCDELICSSCPRVYHNDCLRKRRINPFQSDFCECKKANVHGSVPNFVWFPPELAEMLKYAMQEAVKDEKKSPKNSQKAENDQFHKIKTWPVVDENKVLLKIIDIDFLIDKIHQTPPYQSTGEFFLDVKWMHHNCCILYGADHALTKAAVELEKKIKQELLDIEACRECYKRKCVTNPLNSNYFTKVCRHPHIIVWAKIRGSPFWPAKCLKIHKGHADVRFFGTHDKAIVMLNQIFYISKVHPEGKHINKMPKLKEAFDELLVYVSYYESTFGRSFVFYDKRVPVKETNCTETRKNSKRRKRSGNHAESPVLEENNSSELKKPKILTKMKGIETKIEANLHSSCDSLEDSHRQENPNNPASLEENAPSNSIGYVHMTFADDDETNPNDVIANSFMSTCASQYSVTTNHPKQEIFLPSEPSDCTSHNQSKTEMALSSANEALNIHPVTHLLPSSCIKTDQIKQHFTNVNVSASLPVITSAQSAVGPEDISVNVPVSKDSCSSDTTSDCFKAINQSISNDSCSPGDKLQTNNLGEEKAESDDEIQVLKETHNNPLVDYISQNGPVSRTLCELLLSNKPGLRNSLHVLQTAGLEFILKTWLEIHATKMDNNELKEFQRVYSKFGKRIEFLQDQNAELKMTIASLRAKIASQEVQIKSLLEQKSQKDALRDEIVKATASKLKDAELEKLASDRLRSIMELEEKCNLLKENNKVLEEKCALKESSSKVLEEKYNALKESSKELEEGNKNLLEKVRSLEEKVEQDFKKILELEKDKNKILESKKQLLKIVKKQQKSISNKHSSDKLLPENECSFTENDVSASNTSSASTSAFSLFISEKSQLNDFQGVQDFSDSHSSILHSEISVPQIHSGISHCHSDSDIPQPQSSVSQTHSSITVQANNNRVVVQNNSVTMEPTSDGLIVTEESILSDYDVSHHAGAFVAVPEFPHLPVLQCSKVNSCSIPIVSQNPNSDLLSQPGTSSNCQPETDRGSTKRSCDKRTQHKTKSSSSKIAVVSSKKSGSTKPSTESSKLGGRSSKSSGESLKPSRNQAGSCKPKNRSGSSK